MTGRTNLIHKRPIFEEEFPCPPEGQAASHLKLGNDEGVGSRIDIRSWPLGLE